MGAFDDVQDASHFGHVTGFELPALAGNLIVPEFHRGIVVSAVNFAENPPGGDLPGGGRPKIGPALALAKRSINEKTVDRNFRRIHGSAQMSGRWEKNVLPKYHLGDHTSGPNSTLRSPALA
jgi:hypothetical protein